jgi:hypothetical protein
MIYEGDFATPPGRFAILAARFNAAIEMVTLLKKLPS